MADHATPVCEISNGGVTTYLWLCLACQGWRMERGWSVKETGRTAAWPCDDCPRPKRAPVQFLATPADAALNKTPRSSSAPASSVNIGLFE